MLSVLSVLIAHCDISVHRCIWVCISVLINISFFQINLFCTLQAHWCSMYTRVHNILYDEHFLLRAILDVYWCARKTQHVPSLLEHEFAYTFILMCHIKI